MTEAEHLENMEFIRQASENAKVALALEEIKAEIDKVAQGHNPMNSPFDSGYTIAIMDVFEIIDKHTM